jgi:hypothetical protein
MAWQGPLRRSQARKALSGKTLIETIGHNIRTMKFFSNLTLLIVFCIIVWIVGILKIFTVSLALSRNFLQEAEQ